VLQLRLATGLLDYPRGKSAMVHYAHADDVRAAALAWAAAHGSDGIVCRHLIEGDGATAPAALYAKVVDDFVRRSARCPSSPESGPPEPPMKLVEAESTGPVEGDAALVTPPRPPHRRVSVSLVFTLTVLVGTVVTIYAMFPRATTCC